MRVGLRAGAGGGGDGHDGQAGLLGPLLFAGAEEHIVPQIAAVGRYQADGLGRVHDTAAAQSHDEITAALSGEAAALLHHGLGGVGGDLVKHDILHAGLLQFVLQPVQIAARPCGPAAGDDHQGSFAVDGAHGGVDLGVELVQLARAE